MSLSAMLYWIDVLENIQSVLLTCFIFSIIISFIVGFVTIMHYDQQHKGYEQALYVFKFAVVSSIMIGTVMSFIPRKQTMYLMIGVGAAQDIVNNPKVQEVGGKVLSIINQKLDELDNKGEKK